jgi:formylglycine-generating enzyme required for sulfatase activity
MFTRFVFFTLTLFNSVNFIFAQKPVIEWVNIPAGTFSMGSPINEPFRFDDEIQHTVSINAFRMSKYEITFDQYQLFCKATGKITPNDEGWGRGKRPVINVSRDDAMECAKWMGGRLPTEAEWEYAARAGTTTPFPNGNCITTKQANYNGQKPYVGCIEGLNLRKSVPVGSYPPNAWGLHDMNGNVWEWCSDWYGDYSPEPQTNPMGIPSGSCAIIRGGSWYCFEQHCRSAYRSCYDPTTLNHGIGFRIVSGTPVD